MFQMRAPTFAGRRVAATAAGKTLTEDGIWQQQNDRRAIAVNGEPVAGGITSDGDLKVFYEGGSVDLYGSTFGVDDHNTPSLLVRQSDSRVLALALGHNGSSALLYTSANPNDPTSFGAAANIASQLGRSSLTYPNLRQLGGEGNDPLFFSFRALGSGSTHHYYYSKANDTGGAPTFATATRLLTNDGNSQPYSPYVIVSQKNDTRLDFWCTNGHSQFTPGNNLHHFYYEGGSFYETDGTSLTLPILPGSDLTPINDIPDTTVNIYGGGFDASGNPAVVYAVNFNALDHRYYRAVWNGSGWDRTFICTGGGNFSSDGGTLSSGAWIDPNDANTVYVARTNFEGTHNLWRYTYSAGWSGVQITDESDDCFRPFIIEGVSEPKLGFLKGSFTNLNTFDTSIELRASTANPGILKTVDIDYVGSQTVVLNTASPTSWTLDSLSGGDAGISDTIEAGDIIICSLFSPTGGARDTGCNQFSRAIPGITSIQYSTTSSLTIHRCVASQSGPISGQFSSSSGWGMVAIFSVFRGAATDYDTTPATYTGGGDSPNPPSVTPVTAGAMIYYAGMVRQGSGEIDSLPGLSNATGATAEGTADSAGAVGFKRDWTSGAFNADPWHHTGSGADSAVAGVLPFKPGTPNADYASRGFIIGGGSTDGSATLRDYGLNQLALTANGNAQTDTDITLAGLNSVLLDGTGDWVEVESNLIGFLSRLNSFDWTIDAKVRFAALSGTDQTFLSKYSTPSDQRAFLWRYSAPNGLDLTLSSNGAATTSINTAWSPSTGTTYDLRVCKSGTTYRLFIDGIYQTKATYAGHIYSEPTESAAPWRIGAIFNSGGSTLGFNGNIAMRWTMKALNTTDDNYTPDATWTVA